jgi:hypothetical protein
MTATVGAESSQDARRLLAIYLRDHHAGAAGGLSLLRRCRGSNEGTELGEVLATIEREVVSERHRLEGMMSRLGVEPSRVKGALAAAADLAGRIKRNGRITRYSPSSRVLELEMLAAAFMAKRKLWETLAEISDRHPELDRAELEQLARLASSQHDRVTEQHGRAVLAAFAPPT